jgi:penicillin-binding protein 1A
MRRKYKFLIFIETIFVVLLTFFFIGLAVVFILISIYVSNLPSIEIVTENIRGGSTQIYDRKGEVLLYEIGLRQYPVSYEEIPKTVIYSTLAAEDDSFFEHKGVSIKGILRSIILNIKTGSLTYGGSTITQQLARNLFLTQEKSVIRKNKRNNISLGN